MLFLLFHSLGCLELLCSEMRAAVASYAPFADPSSLTSAKAKQLNEFPAPLSVEAGVDLLLLEDVRVQKDRTEMYFTPFACDRILALHARGLSGLEEVEADLPLLVCLALDWPTVCYSAAALEVST